MVTFIEGRFTLTILLQAKDGRRLIGATLCWRFSDQKKFNTMEVLTGEALIASCEEGTIEVLVSMDGGSALQFAVRFIAPTSFLLRRALNEGPVQN